MLKIRRLRAVRIPKSYLNQWLVQLFCSFLLNNQKANAIWQFKLGMLPYQFLFCIFANYLLVTRLGYVVWFFQAVDAALIPTTSFPAFATHDEYLSSSTKDSVVQQLKGQNGFKRFPRDGYKTVLEDQERRFYKNGETKVCLWCLGKGHLLNMIVDCFDFLNGCKGSLSTWKS